VKCWTASSTFSHLLAQGAISAEALTHEAKFRNHVRTRARKHQAAIKRLFPGEHYDPSRLEVVFSLVRESPKALPFFSRLNLMREGERIQRLGYKVAYQRIEVQ
jgi:uncharacterized protein (TIGR04141 family)